MVKTSAEPRSKQPVCSNSMLHDKTSYLGEEID